MEGEGRMVQWPDEWHGCGRVALKEDHRWYSMKMKDNTWHRLKMKGRKN